MMEDQGWERSVTCGLISDRVEFGRRAVDPDRHRASLLRSRRADHELAAENQARGAHEPQFTAVVTRRASVPSLSVRRSHTRMPGTIRTVGSWLSLVQKLSS